MDDPSDPPPSIDSDYRLPEPSPHPPSPHLGPASHAGYAGSEVERMTTSVVSHSESEQASPPPYLVPENPELVTRPPPYVG